MSILKLLKRLPIDVGQAEYATKTKGKQIALSLVSPGGIVKTALDVGCNEGIQSKWLEDKGYEVTSIDIQKDYDKCIVVDINKGLSFPDGSFDLIWCSEVLEHIDNPAYVIAEFRRVLKPGGELILTTPNSHCWFYWFFGLFNIKPAQMQMGVGVGTSIEKTAHKQFFSIQDMCQLFPSAEIFGYFPYAIIKCKIKSLVGLLSPTFVVHEKKLL